MYEPYKIIGLILRWTRTIPAPTLPGSTTTTRHEQEQWMTAHRAIVVGLGGLGSAALHRIAAELGPGVLGIEQFALGHHRGASQDHSRIIRLAQHQAHYAALAAPAYAAWHEVEAESGQRLLTRTGGLVVEDRVARRGIDSGTRNIEGYCEVFDRFGVTYELLDADTLVERWPQFRVDGGEQALYQAESGIVDAAKANAVHIALARAHGAEIMTDTPVRAVRPDGDGVAVVTDRGTLRADRVVVTADAWTNRVLGETGPTLPLTVLQEQVTYYSTPHLAEFAPSRFPVFMWHGRHNFYGFPVHGEVATKLGQHMGGHETTAEDRTFEPDPVRRARYADFVARHIPRFGGPELYTKTCLYTVPPDQDFIIDTLPEHPQVVVANGAGHAFKFAALIGQLLADLVVGRAPSHPIDAFSITRPALTDPAFPRSFHV
jgi:sarcosine oxidase